MILFTSRTTSFSEAAESSAAADPSSSDSWDSSDSRSPTDVVSTATSALLPPNTWFIVAVNSRFVVTR